MHGTGVPLVTPFDDAGTVDHDALRELTDWVTERGVDFVVPCGSNSESELLTLEERAAVVETVAEAAPAATPVLAGTGHPGLVETREQTRRAAEAGADAALVVSPYYYKHAEASIGAYYREVADDAALPVYLYNVPKYTGVTLSPALVADLAEHANVAGLKDSGGDLETLLRFVESTPDDFAVFAGSGGTYAHALEAGADGGILAFANVLPERAAEVYRLHEAGKDAEARQVNRRCAALNRAVTSEHGVPGLKAAMRARDLPAGRARSPHRPVASDIEASIRSLVADALP
ncbi:dihydrodipicolinate synthase family protein [Halarchaeum sp. CBA1220]|uniref:dihydrodipicolinate synthase family protein n=1 Tax=Halarchaeum sp. CBA1220 TaxID=1853682 RepID=UPI000F3A9C0D|nr:dihydrodipicolinate synthase family protein [Halarchaeum sp. CBA1220]QLC33146.1 dihydrodipicolinate synthase family protein [Halarchaeum sp. CBA1220]